MFSKNFRLQGIAKSFLLLAFSLSGFTQIYAQDIPEKPNPPRLVNDFTGTLSAGEINQLEQKLVYFNDSTSTQIVVVLVPSLQGYEKYDFAQRLGEKWGVGQKGKNNGIIVLVKPKISSERGEAFISPGYGLEAVVPDAICKRIVENEMIPYFNKGDYAGGINKAANVLISLTKGEYTADQYSKRAKNKGKPYGFLVPFIVLAIIFIMVKSSARRSYSVGKSVPWWMTLFLISNMGRSGNHWNDFSSGGGSFGSFGDGGGGFGGFGGGSFGGGGAGGSW